MLRLSSTSTSTFVREVNIGQVFQHVRIVNGRVPVGHLHMAPAFERREQHEQVGGAVALVLIIDTRNASRPHRDRHTRFGDELLGRLVQANQHLVGIMRPHVDGQHVLHRGYKGAVGLRRDNPALPAMGFETIFLSVRPMVESLARSTMPSSTTVFSNSRSVQRAYPCGGLEQARAISLASFSPSNMRGAAGVTRGLRLRTASNPSSTVSGPLAP